MLGIDEAFPHLGHRTSSPLYPLLVYMQYNNETMDQLGARQHIAFERGEEERYGYLPARKPNCAHGIASIMTLVSTNMSIWHRASMLPCACGGIG